MLEPEIPDPPSFQRRKQSSSRAARFPIRTSRPKRLREEYSKMVAGLALRYVSEIMLHLPTVRVVQAEGWRVVTDSATGIR